MNVTPPIALVVTIPLHLGRLEVLHLIGTSLPEDLCQNPSDMDAGTGVNGVARAVICLTFCETNRLHGLCFTVKPAHNRLVAMGMSTALEY
mmetsp:Transcript_30748/g.59333  ORF Transcript_30748/g.59333 Transcript_30748/m.59333 type:complete len:91 (-) Transcript_30748:8-280(-)